MATNKSKFSAVIKELASADIHKWVKSFISDLYGQFDAVKADYFKPEHREEFLRLRAQCRDLINQTRGFCDKAIPPIEYAVAQYSSPNPVNVKTLAEKVLSRVNPKDVIEQCEKVENTIMIFNDRIGSDEYYKKNNIKYFLSIGFGAAFVITSLVTFFYAPVLLETELALLACDSLASNVLLPSMNLFCSGLDKIRAVDNFKQYKEIMIEASKYTTQLKTVLSDINLKHGCLEIRLEMQDVHDLKPIYDDLLKTMRDIRELCLKPFPML